MAKLSKAATEYQTKCAAMSEHDRMAFAVKSDREFKAADDRRRGANAAVFADVRERGLLLGCVREGNSWTGHIGGFKVTASLDVPGSGPDVKNFSPSEEAAYRALPWHSWISDRLVFRKA